MGTDKLLIGRAVALTLAMILSVFLEFGSPTSRSTEAQGMMALEGIGRRQHIEHPEQACADMRADWKESTGHLRSDLAEAIAKECTSEP